MKRFWDKVNKTSTCWDWIAYKDKYGYGKFSFNKKSERAHRVSWFLTYNRWPSKWVLHKCNNRNCVNTSHLYEGTPRDNTKDSIRSGTFKISILKITDDMAVEIKDKYKTGKFNLRQLALEYNVCHGTISKILKRFYQTNPIGRGN